ncbi:hypothetical protein EST38_g11448 [Candolleomyces aberdarensis]|uniref:FAD/NAD(P)-binding domain-containing protein n=1 Tax=Candolleomyces aberdarensis TaxID=2316362 RepID=A0A4Q2D7J0_9AGAR|nr:hypothetical protein EST38_g11448 [Candolleomyces aberdarensis]
MSSRKNIVIVGGGPFGASVAKGLSSASSFDTTRYRLILVTPRPFFVHLPALIRTAVTSAGSLEDEILMPYDDFMKGKGEVKVGTVASFSEGKEGGEVVLQSGEKIPYSVLVLTPGSIWEGPLNLPESESDIRRHFGTWRQTIEKANDIVLVGGGSVGIEFAGELKDFYPTKHVTLVHGQHQLLNSTYPDRYRDALLRRVRKTGTDVVLGEYIDSTEPSEDGTITTRNGKHFRADLVIPTRGGRPNTALVSASLGANALTSTGHIKVQPTLQLTGHPQIFAGGDAIEWKEQKQAGKARGHAPIIVENVLNVLTKGAGTTEGLVFYKGSTEMIITTVGRSGGVSYFGFLWGIVLGDWFSRLIKSKGLVIEMSRGNLGLGRLQK